LENMGIGPQFWQGKRVLITGHTGFKGGWLSLWLQQLGAEVTGVALDSPTVPNFYQQAAVADEMKSLRVDIRNGEEIKQIFRQNKPEFVFHLAAQPLVRYSYQHPVETYETNVMGTLHVLEGIRAVDSVSAAVMITTDKCYENREWVWGYRENDPMGGHDPYSSSKGAAELLIASYRDSYFPADRYSDHRTTIASVRAGNVIGGGDWAEDRLIPDLIRAFQQGEEVLIRSPKATRPWQHVLEPLAGYLMLAEKLSLEGARWSGGWNFGPFDQDVKPVEWICEQMVQLWGEEACWRVDGGTHSHEANYLKLDCSKANMVLEWLPQWSLQQALQSIVDWHQADLQGQNMRLFSLSQIDQYLNANRI
jgi:CDP-glucose 4,6-dehydratase